MYEFVCDLVQKMYLEKRQLLDIMGIFHDNSKARQRYANERWCPTSFWSSLDST
jgi:hypothetical protein